MIRKGKHSNAPIFPLNSYTEVHNTFAGTKIIKDSGK
jgi:hypothetical protein